MNHDDDIALDVERQGWSRIVVRDAKPPFVYSVGLMYTANHPELILFGLSDAGPEILAGMAYLIREGKSFASPDRYDGVLERGAVATRPVHPSQHPLYLGYAMAYCRRQGDIGGLKAVQVFWPDKAGLFPFERGCEDSVYLAQRRLDQPVMPDELREFKRKYGSHLT